MVPSKSVNELSETTDQVGSVVCSLGVRLSCLSSSLTFFLLIPLSNNDNSSTAQ